MCNSQKVIIFVLSIKASNMSKTTKRAPSEKSVLKSDLHFYLEYYNKVSDRMKDAFDKEIERIIERLKELGKR